MFLSLSSVVSKNSEDVPLGRFRSLVCSERDSWSRAPRREAFSAMALILRAAMSVEVTRTAIENRDFGRKVPVADGSDPAACEKVLHLAFPCPDLLVFLQQWFVLPIFFQLFIIAHVFCLRRVIMVIATAMAAGVTEEATEVTEAVMMTRWVTLVVASEP